MRRNDRRNRPGRSYALRQAAKTAFWRRQTKARYRENRRGRFFPMRIRQLGCRIALDDFGTGYSSLAYITRFPPDRIEIDKVQGFLLARPMAAEELERRFFRRESLEVAAGQRVIRA